MNMPMLAHRLRLVCFLLNTAFALTAVAQQQISTQQPIAPGAPPQSQQVPMQAQMQPSAQPAPLQPPDGFALNALQQAQLDAVLNTWQTQSANIKTFKCTFERWEFDAAFGPKDQTIPLNKNDGELSYSRPDKGSFQITKIKTFQAKPVAPGQQPANPPQGDWVEQPQAIGEHWVCDGKSVYEYREDRKELVERPIPPQMQGQAIVDGPLPFLFGAEAAKLKARYWMRLETAQNAGEIFLTAMPKYQAQAADFRSVEVILDQQQMLPKAMRVTLPNGDKHVYIFSVKSASVNSPFAILQGMFNRPSVPFGWKHIVEQMPQLPAAQAPNQVPVAEAPKKDASETR
jgi:TIGR03009 family protein